MMETTLDIMQYDADAMRNILDNLMVWDWQKKVHHKNCITYKEEKRRWSTGGCSVFTVTAIKEPLLVFYTIGQLVEEKINKPIKDAMPKMA